MHSGRWQKHRRWTGNDLKKIPIRQETVEICEYFDVNPYGLISSGMMLMASADGNALVLALQEAGIPGDRDRQGDRGQ